MVFTFSSSGMRQGMQIKRRIMFHDTQKLQKTDIFMSTNKVLLELSFIYILPMAALAIIRSQS